MNKTSLMFMVSAMLGAAFCAHAADTNSTVTTRKASIPFGVAPTVGVVEVVSTVSGSQSFTFDLPTSHGSSDIIAALPAATDANGVAKPLTITRNGATVTVAGSNAASGTLAVGDVVRVVVVYQP